MKKLALIGVVAILGVLAMVSSHSSTSPTTPVAQNAQSQPMQAHFSDGIHIVGQDVSPGTYRTRSGSPGCYYARLAGFSGTVGKIIANENADAPAVVTISPSDKGFESRGCGIWTQDLSPISSSRTEFEDGTYIVGSDIQPGVYRNNGQARNCYYERLSGFGGVPGETITNELTDSPSVVEISPTDRGFRSAGCGTWQLISSPATLASTPGSTPATAPPANQPSSTLEDTHKSSLDPSEAKEILEEAKARFDLINSSGNVLAYTTAIRNCNLMSTMMRAWGTQAEERLESVLKSDDPVKEYRVRIEGCYILTGKFIERWSEGGRPDINPGLELTGVGTMENLETVHRFFGDAMSGFTTTSTPTQQPQLISASQPSVPSASPAPAPSANVTPQPSGSRAPAPPTPAAPTTTGAAQQLPAVASWTSDPIPISSPNPEFSDEARRDKISGTCLVDTVVDENGIPQNPTVFRALGHGLDEKAVEAVRKYKFKPAMKNGKPVPKLITIEVPFRFIEPAGD